MKIITNNIAYVQKKDIDYLKKSDLPIPEFIFMKVFGTNILDDNNDYEFIKFNKANEIDYFASLDWIIDYNDVKNLSELDIVKLCEKIVKEINQIAEKYNNMSDRKKMRNENMVIKCELLDYKMKSLRDALWYKQGHINMRVPVTFEYETYTKKDKNKIKELLNKFKTPK